MNIGKLRHRLIFQSETPLPDGAHGHTSRWDNFVTVWGNVEPLSGRELYYSQQIKNTISHKATVRYREGFTEGMRIIHGTRIFAIESIINIEEKNIFISMRCSEDK